MNNLHQYIPLLSKVRLFNGIDEDTLEDLSQKWSYILRKYQKGEIIMAEQRDMEYIGILLGGNAYGYRSTEEGKNVILARMTQGAVFADILAGAPMRKSPIAIRAESECKVLFIHYDSYIQSCIGNTHIGTRLIMNYVESVSSRYFELHDRVRCLIMPSLRAKIMSCLQSYCPGRGKPFAIPFDRSSMAEYINADRSALSRELAKMKSEGIIDYRKNIFKLT